MFIWLLKKNFRAIIRKVCELINMFKLPARSWIFGWRKEIWRKGVRIPMPIGNNVSLLIIVYCLISQLERFVTRILKILYRQPNSTPQSHQFTSSIVCKCCTSVEKQQYRIAVNKVIVRVFIYIKARGMQSGKRERGEVCAL